MDHLDEISTKELQQVLEKVEGKKPTQRLIAVIAYKKRCDPNRTCRVVQRAATHDLHGRPRKLTNDQQEQLEQILHQPPTEAGYDAPAWTPALVCRYLEETFDVDYSLPSCRRLMKEAGLSYQKPLRITAEADLNDREQSHDEAEKSDGRWMPQ